MLIAHSIINVLNLRESKLILSDKELDYTKDLTGEYVNKIIKKINNSSIKRKGKFNETSKLYNLVKSFSKDTNFIEFSHEISKMFFEELKKSETYVKTDQLILEYRENDFDTLAIVLLENEESVISEYNNGEIQLTKSLYNLPKNVLAIKTFILIDLKTFEFYSSERFKLVEGVKHKVVEENIVDANFSPSTSDIYKTLKKEALELSGEDSKQSLETLASLKEHINRHMDEEYLDVVSLADDLFKDKTIRDEFVSKSKLNGVSETVPLEYSLVSNKTLNSTIKTDTGISLTIPNDYLKNNDNVEIKDNPDGTMSIVIKNVTKLVGR